MVVAAGITGRIPEVGTLPMPLSTVTAVAPETDQTRTEEAPLVMIDGLAVKLLMAGSITGGTGVGGGGDSVTVYAHRHPRTGGLALGEYPVVAPWYWPKASSSMA